MKKTHGKELLLVIRFCSDNRFHFLPDKDSTPFRHLRHAVLLVSLFAVRIPRVFAFETQVLVIPKVKVIIPGVSGTITITQDDVYPQGINQLVIMAIGYGGITIETTLTAETAQEGNLLTLTVLGISSAKIVPVLMFGQTDASLTAAVEVGNERLTFGVVWISSWVNSSKMILPMSISS